jgi:hypothetical protein
MNTFICGHDIANELEEGDTTKRFKKRSTIHNSSAPTPTTDLSVISREYPTI